MFVDKGVPRHVSVGDLMSESDPGFKGRESLFEKVEVHVENAYARRHGLTETASAAPNEVRTVTPPPSSRPAPVKSSRPNRGSSTETTSTGSAE